jgi:hypothetical protein
MASWQMFSVRNYATLLFIQTGVFGSRIFAQVPPQCDCVIIERYAIKYFYIWGNVITRN